MQTKLCVMQIDKHLYNEINEYCKLNNLKTRDFIHKILREAFNKEKFGDSPFAFNKKVEDVVKEPEVIVNDEPEKIIEPVINDKLLNLTVEIFNKTFGANMTQVEPLPLEMVKQIEPEKKENLKPKKKRALT